MSPTARIILIVLIIMSLVLGVLAGNFYSSAEDRLRLIHRAQEKALIWINQGLAYFASGIESATNDSLSNAERLMWANFACLGGAFVDSSADEILATFDSTSHEYLGFNALRDTIWHAQSKFLDWYKYPLDLNASSGYPFTPNSTVDQAFRSIPDIIQAIYLETTSPSAIDKIDFEAINAYCAEIRQVIDPLGYPQTGLG